MKIEELIKALSILPPHTEIEGKVDHYKLDKFNNETGYGISSTKYVTFTIKNTEVSINVNINEFGEIAKTEVSVKKVKKNV